LYTQPISKAAILAASLRTAVISAVLFLRILVYQCYCKSINQLPIRRMRKASGVSMAALTIVVFPSPAVITSEKVPYLEKDTAAY